MPAILTSDSMDAPESKEEVVVIDEEVDSRSKESKVPFSLFTYQGCQRSETQHALMIYVRVSIL